MAYKIDTIEGIGATYAQKLGEVGIATTDDLLEKCAGRAGRQKVAEETGISGKLVLSWANMADLMRISGVAGEYAELLHAAGVDTVKELRNRNAGNLATKMAEVNGQKNLTRAVPSETVVTKWVEAAKSMEPKITH